MTHILNFQELEELLSPLALRNYTFSFSSVLLLPGHPVRFSVLGVNGRTIVTDLDGKQLNDYFEEVDV